MCYTRPPYSGYPRLFTFVQENRTCWLAQWQTLERTLLFWDVLLSTGSSRSPRNKAKHLPGTLMPLLMWNVLLLNGYVIVFHVTVPSHILLFVLVVLPCVCYFGSVCYLMCLVNNLVVLYSLHTHRQHNYMTVIMFDHILDLITICYCQLFPHVYTSEQHNCVKFNVLPFLYIKYMCD